MVNREMCYDIVCVKDGKFVARFFDETQALKAKKWLNEEVFKTNYADIKTVTLDKLNGFYVKKAYGVTFDSFLDFKKNIYNQIEINKTAMYYTPKTNGITFVKFDNYWWELDTKTSLNNATIYNRMGGKQTELDLTNAQIMEAQKWSDLDWKGTSVYDNKYQTGWLSPQGVFYGCDYTNHTSQAKLVHNLTEREMENLGWIKLTHIRNNFNEVVALMGYDRNYNRILPTKEQMSYLIQSDIANLDEIKFNIRVYRQQNINNQNEK